ncbi:hypothetical protein BDZ91DRAFT_807068 [Kalaharituber pfeilii]|nr:hypothetical protein BDZ91DRAFT_807068 [Kalaharituber pfeilii]
MEFHRVQDWKLHEHLKFIAEEQQWTLHKFHNIIEHSKKEGLAATIEGAISRAVSRGEVEEGKEYEVAVKEVTLKDILEEKRVQSGLRGAIREVNMKLEKMMGMLERATFTYPEWPEELAPEAANQQQDKDKENKQSTQQFPTAEEPVIEAGKGPQEGEEKAIKHHEGPEESQPEERASKRARRPNGTERNSSSPPSVTGTSNDDETEGGGWHEWPVPRQPSTKGKRRVHTAGERGQGNRQRGWKGREPDEEGKRRQREQVVRRSSGGGDRGAKGDGEYRAE